MVQRNWPYDSIMGLAARASKGDIKPLQEVSGG
jgi:hypothetical protein